MRKALLTLFSKHNPLKSLSLLLCCGFLISCSTQTKYIEMEDFGKNSKAAGAAYAADAMYVRPLMKSHADWKPQSFYFKECEEIGEKAYYSKTYYECTKGPR